MKQKSNLKGNLVGIVLGLIVLIIYPMFFKERSLPVMFTDEGVETRLIREENINTEERSNSNENSSTSSTTQNQSSSSNYSCPDLANVRLHVGDRAVIVFDDVNLRTYAQVPDDYYANIVTELHKNTQMTVIGGPECAHSGTWWEIKTDSGYRGWMREFTSSNRLLDVLATNSSANSGNSSSGSSSSGTSGTSSSSSLQIPSCSGSLPTQVYQLGMTIRVTTNGRVPKLGIRPDPTLESHKMHTLPSGTQMTVLDGPICSDNSYFWFVNTPNGKGWVREGNTEFYFIDPVN